MPIEIAMTEQHPLSQHDQNQKLPKPTFDKTWKWNERFSFNKHKNNHQHNHIQQKQRRRQRRHNNNSSLNNPHLPPLIRFLSLPSSKHNGDRYRSSFGLHHSPSESLGGILPYLLGNDDKNADNNEIIKATIEDDESSIIKSTTAPSRQQSGNFGLFGLHHPPFSEILPFLTKSSSSSIFKSSSVQSTSPKETPPPQFEDNPTRTTKMTTENEIDSHPDSTIHMATKTKEEEEREDFDSSSHDDTSDKNNNDDDEDSFDFIEGYDRQKRYAEDGEDPLDLIERANVSTATDHWTSSYLFSRASILLEKRRKKTIIDDGTATANQTSSCNLKGKSLECRNRARINLIKALQVEMEKEEEEAAGGRHILLEEGERARRMKLFSRLFCHDDDADDDGKEEVWSKILLCEEEGICDEDTIAEVSNEKRSFPFNQDEDDENDDDSQITAVVLVSASTETTEVSSSSSTIMTDEEGQSKPVDIIVEKKDGNSGGRSVSPITGVERQEGVADENKEDCEVVVVSPSSSSDISLENISVDNEKAYANDMGMCIRIPFFNDDEGGVNTPRNAKHGHISENRCLIDSRPHAGKLKCTSPEVYNEKSFDGCAISDNAVDTTSSLCNSVYDGILVDAVATVDHFKRFEVTKNIDGLDDDGDDEYIEMNGSTEGVEILEDGDVGASPEKEDEDWEISPKNNIDGNNENEEDDPWVVVIER